jgi:hypothetical protein
VSEIAKIGVTIDCADPEMLAGFWARFLGYQLLESGGSGPYITIERPSDLINGPPSITFQRVPEPKAGKVRMHLDLFVDHAGPVFTEMVSAGATSIETTEAGEWTTRVLSDPAGNEFCLIGPE